MSEHPSPEAEFDPQDYDDGFGVEVPRADRAYDEERNEDTAVPGRNDMPNEAVAEQRRLVALQYASGLSNDLDSLLTNALRIEDFLKGTHVESR